MQLACNNSAIRAVCQPASCLSALVPCLRDTALPICTPAFLERLPPECKFSCRPQADGPASRCSKGCHVASSFARNLVCAAFTVQSCCIFFYAFSKTLLVNILGFRIVVLFLKFKALFLTASGEYAKRLPRISPPTVATANFALLVLRSRL